MKRFMNKKVAAIGAAVGLTLGLGGAAFAYFTSTGGGSGTATTGQGSTVTISDNGPYTGLVPGGPSQDITATVVNPLNAQSQYVAGVTAYLTVSESALGISSGGAYTCSAADFLLDGIAGADSGSPVAMDWTAQDLAPSGSAQTAGDDTIQFNDLTTTNQDACQNATVTIHYASN